MHNNENYWLRVQKVCEIYKYYKAKGYQNEYIYNNYIKDAFFISRSTFYNYLALPYRKHVERDISKEVAEAEKAKEKKSIETPKAKAKTIEETYRDIFSIPSVELTPLKEI